VVSADLVMKQFNDAVGTLAGARYYDKDVVAGVKFEPSRPHCFY
jgi:hypothetical protein